MGCKDGMLILCLRFPRMRPFCTSQHSENKLWTLTFLRTSSFAHICNRNRIFDLNVPCQSQDRSGSGPLGYFFISKEQEFTVAFGEGRNLRQPSGFVISMVWVSSRMAVMEFKCIKPRSFLMLPFSQTMLLRQNRFSILCSSSFYLIPDHCNFSADRSWKKVVLYLFWCSRLASRVNVMQ